MPNIDIQIIGQGPTILRISGTKSRHSRNDSLKRAMGVIEHPVEEDIPNTVNQPCQRNAKTEHERPRDPAFFNGLYSPSGIDMMNMLIRVVSRPNPKINIGMVDLSCAFTLCDTSKPDSPIVYCSEAFEALTGYKRDEILGKNCRFLQSPHGVDRGPNVPLHRSSSEGENENEDGGDRGKKRRISPQAGDLGQHTRVSQIETCVEVQSEKTTKRKRDSQDMRNMRDKRDLQHEKDKQTLLGLKALIARREEAQVEVMNYKKGGIPFTNILTTIPVSAASPSERPRYILGLQVDRSMCFL